MHIVSTCFLRGLYAPNCRCPSRWLGVFIWLAEFSLLTSHMEDALIRKAQGLMVWVVEEGPPRHERTAAAEVWRGAQRQMAMSSPRSRPAVTTVMPIMRLAMPPAWVYTSGPSKAQR